MIISCQCLLFFFGGSLDFANFRGLSSKMIQSLTNLYTSLLFTKLLLKNNFSKFSSFISLLNYTAIFLNSYC